MDLIAQIDAYAESIQKQIAIGDVNISRGMAIRELVKRGLQSVQAVPPPPPTPQPAIPLALEPAPKATLSPVEPQVDAPQETQPSPLVTHETLIPLEEADQEPAPAADLPLPAPPTGVQTVHLPEPREPVHQMRHAPDQTPPAGPGRPPQPPQEPWPAAPMPPAPQPPSHLATVEESEPIAPPMATPQAPAAPSPEAAPDEERIVETPSTRSQRGLPREKLQEIADMAAQYHKLSLAQLSQFLYDRNIYRAKDRKSGEEKPVHRGTLQHWLDQARAEGML